LQRFRPELAVKECQNFLRNLNGKPELINNNYQDFNMILLSHILDPKTPSYGNRDKFIIEETSCITKGASANSSKWTFSSNHLGTHIDMPKHFFEEGQTLTDVPIDFWFSDKIQLIDIPCDEAELVTVNHLIKEINNEIEILLIRTGYERFRDSDKYWNDNPGLSASLGEWLRNHKPNIKMVGFDFISLTSWKKRDHGKIAHQTFLNMKEEGNPICIIEDMALGNLQNQLSSILISPVFVKDTNGAPVTVYGFLK
jgi:arylformamidase